MKIMAYLRPTPGQIERLALDETDPARYERFAPITRGPLYAACVVAFVCLMAVVVTPVRLAVRVATHKSLDDA